MTAVFLLDPGEKVPSFEKSVQHRLCNDSVIPDMSDYDISPVKAYGGDQGQTYLSDEKDEKGGLEDVRRRFLLDHSLLCRSIR